MLQIVKGFPQQGKWNLKLNSSDIGQYNGVAKNLYKDTKVFIRVNCHPTADKNTEITIGWILRETQVEHYSNGENRLRISNFKYYRLLFIAYNFLTFIVLE